jgi:ketosteroid isomerase-like protein
VDQGGEEPAVTGIIDETTVHVEGDGVAWAAGRGRFRAADGRERPVRLGAVLVREGDRWRVAHTHASVGLPDQDLFA